MAPRGSALPLPSLPPRWGPLGHGLRERGGRRRAGAACGAGEEVVGGERAEKVAGGGRAEEVAGGDRGEEAQAAVCSIGSGGDGEWGLSAARAPAGGWGCPGSRAGEGDELGSSEHGSSRWEEARAAAMGGGGGGAGCRVGRRWMRGPPPAGGEARGAAA